MAFENVGGAGGMVGLPRFVNQRKGQANTLMVAVIGIVLAWHGESPRGLIDQLVFLALAGAMVPVLLVLAGTARRLSQRRVAQREQMRALLARMRDLAEHDDLTGLYNRRYMQRLLKAEGRRRKHAGRPTSVALLDIDHFKQINDRHGHAVGDAVLKTFAALATVALEGSAGVIARWGGEEFLWLMPQTSEAQACVALARFRALLAAYDWSRLGDGLRVSCSAGVSAHVPGQPVERTVDRADLALYRAKDQGRDQVQVHQGHQGNQGNQGLLDAQDPRMSVPAADIDRLLGLAERWLAQRETAPQSDAAAVSPAAPPRPRRSVSTWVQWVLGRDVATRNIIRTSLVSSCNYTILCVALLAYGAPQGLVPAWAVEPFLGVIVVGGVLPYLAVRSGWSMRFRDRAMVMPQMVWAGVGLCLLYVVAPACRPVALHMMCVVMVFGLIDVRPRSTVLIGVMYVAMLGASFGVALAMGQTGFHAVREGLVVLATAFILAMLTFQSRNLARLRQQAAHQRRELEVATARMQALMTHDALTGLVNRQEVHRRLLAEAERAARDGPRFAVALIDLDHFKRLNDTHGHQVGDEALKGFAQAARGTLREADVLGRWGGEEFLLVMPETEPEHNGLRAVDRVREAVLSLPMCPSVPAVQVNFSAGVALWRPGESLDVLLDRADRALYQAKGLGRGCSVLG